MNENSNLHGMVLYGVRRSFWGVLCMLTVASATISWAKEEGSAALFAEVNRLHEAGDFPAAAEELRIRAMQGEPQAQFAYAIAKRLGAGVPYDTLVDWAIRASEAGYRPAAVHLVDLLSDPDRINTLAPDGTLEQARKVVARPAPLREELPLAFGALSKRGGVDISDKASYRWNKQAAEEGLAMAKYNLASIYTTSSRKRMDLYAEAARGGSPHAALALQLVDNIVRAGLRPDPEEILLKQFSLGEKVADLGHPLYARLVAARLRDKWDDDSVKRRAHLFRMSIAGGEADSVLDLGRLLLDAKSSTAAQKREGLDLLRQAVVLRLEGARYELAWYLATSSGPVRDLDSGLRLMKELADEGDVDAMTQYGVLLLESPSKKEAGKEAARYLAKAMESGDIRASFEYGELLLKGEVVERDEAKAFRLIELSARQGYAEAQTRLGWMLANGIGIERDTEEAATWFKLAATKLDYQAFWQLSQLVEAGDGVPQDLEMARKLVRDAEKVYSHSLGETTPIRAEIVARLEGFAGDPDRMVERHVLASMLLTYDQSDPSPLLLRELESLVGAGYRNARRHLASALALRGATEDQVRVVELIQDVQPESEMERRFFAAIRFQAILRAGHERFSEDEFRQALETWLETGDPKAEEVHARVNQEPTPGMTDAEHGEALRALGDRGPNATLVPLHRPNLEYPPQLRFKRIEGTVRLRLKVTRNGTVESVEVVESAHPELERFAVQAARHYRYAPVIKDGEPKASRVELPLRFSLLPR